MKRVYLLVLLFLFISGTSYAFEIVGLQPVSPSGVFSVFSADSLPANKISMELGAERCRVPDFYRFMIRGAYGISDSAELDFTIPYILGYQHSIDGMEDIAAGFKHRFYDEGKYGPSLAYLINVSLPSGRNEFSTEGRYGGGIIVSKRVGPFKGNLNFFIDKPFTKRFKDEISFSAGIEFSAAHNFKLLGEILTKKGHDDDRYDKLEARFGYRIKTADYIYTTLGVGLDLQENSPEYKILLSVSFAPPQEKKEIQKIFEVE